MNTFRIENLELDQIKFLLEALDWAEHFCEYQAMHKQNPGAVVWSDRAREMARTQAELRYRFEKIDGHPPHVRMPVDGLPCHGADRPLSAQHQRSWEELNRMYYWGILYSMGVNPAHVNIGH